MFGKKSATPQDPKEVEKVLDIYVEYGSMESLPPDSETGEKMYRVADFTLSKKKDDIKRREEILKKVAKDHPEIPGI